VKIHGAYPKRVHVEDGIHYFYWDWDLYKPFDYEPVAVHTHSRGKTLLSRFHWHCATIWTQSHEENEKAAVKFTKAIHTPIVKSKSYDYRYVDIEPTLSIEERMEIVNLYIPVLDRLLRGTSFKGKGRNYDRIMQDGGVPEEYLFDVAKVKASIVIGRFPKPEELPETLRNKIWA